MLAKKVSSQPVTNRERKIVYGIIFTVSIITILVGLYGKTPLAKVSAFSPSTNIAIAIAAFQISCLFYGQSKLFNDGSLSVLASGYMIASIFALAYVLLYPEFFFTFTKDPSYNVSSAWLSIFGHANFSLALIIYSLYNSRLIRLDCLRPQTIFRFSFLYGIGFVFATIINHNSLPNIISGDDYSFVATSVSAFVLILLSSISALCLAFNTNLDSRPNLWLLLAVFVHIIEILYGIIGQTRFSLGWYAGRVCQVFSFSIILGVFTYHLSYLTRKLMDVNQKLEEIATMDFLTKINNRRKFITTLEDYWELAQRERKSLCLIMIDIDHFKIYNDTFGHLAGDECLIRVAQELKRIFKRHCDVVSRIGGEEFAILLYNINEREGTKIAEKIRLSMENLKLNTYSIRHPQITVSIGCVSIIPSKHLEPTFIIDIADQALYEAKFKGRNKVIASTFSRDKPPSYYA